MEERDESEKRRDILLVDGHDMAGDCGNNMSAVRGATTAATVSIEGHGVAALCCAHLLSQAGIAYMLRHCVTREQPALLLGSQAADLVRDVCGVDVRQRGWGIERRVVLWGNTQVPVTVPHYATAVAGDVLLETMLAGLPAQAAKGAAESAAWRLKTRSLEGDAFRAYGERRAVTMRTRLQAGVDARSCWIESTADGWLFLLPFNEHEASLICAGTNVEAALRQSRLIIGQTDGLSSPSPAVSIAPRIAQELATAGVLLAGSAAMRFDPLCGEGVGHAVREAYLAVAVVRAALEGQPVDELIAHYSGRLRQAFVQHMQVCSSFYHSGGDAAFWRAEGVALQRGISEMKALTEAQQPTRFAFREESLTAIDPTLIAVT